MTESHGHLKDGKRTPTYNSFRMMKERCLREGHPRYAQYGGRGITVCERWLDKDKGFANFLEDMGERPSPDHSLGRKKIDDSYSKETCRWETEIEQQNNTSRTKFVEVFGEKMSLSRAMRSYGTVKYSTAYKRIWRGWDVTAAIGAVRGVR